MKIMSWPILKYSLFLPNTDCPQQGEDYVRGMHLQKTGFTINIFGQK